MRSIGNVKFQSPNIKSMSNVKAQMSCFDVWILPLAANQSLARKFEIWILSFGFPLLCSGDVVPIEE